MLFFNDILVYNRTWEEHLQHLEQVLKILQEQQFYTKMSKCEFGMTEILYLGYVIDQEGVRVDEQKIATIQD